jgi:flagellar biosynthesis protein FlhG
VQKIISVTSGKGGVGKTLTTINLALAAQSSGLKVLLIDGDFGLANLDVLLGMKPQRTILDVLDGKASIRDVIQKGPRGIDLITSGSGISRLATLGTLERSCLVAELARIPRDYDVVFLDTAAGIAPGVLTLNATADAIVVVTTPEPHSLTDAYALIKVMSEEHDRAQFSLIVNQVRSDDEGTRLGLRISEVAKQFCNVDVTPIGHVRMDPVLMRSIMARRVAWDGALNTIAGQGWLSSWRRLAEKENRSPSVTHLDKLQTVFGALAGQPLDPRTLSSI